MSIKSKLDEIGENLQRRAARLRFLEDDYEVEWASEDREYWESGWGALHPLTLDRYQNGAEPSKNRDDVGGAPNAHYYVKRPSEVWNHVWDEFQWIRDRINEFGKADITELETLLTKMTAACEALCAETSWQTKHGEVPKLGIGATGSEMLLKAGIRELDRWSGAAADTFKDHFEDGKWEELAQNNFYLAEILVQALNAQTATIVAARRDVVAAVEEADQRLSTLADEARDADVSAATAVALTLTIAGCLAGPVGLAFAAGTTAAAATTIVGSTLSITSTVISAANAGNVSDEVAEEADTKDKISIEGATVDDVLDSLNSELYRIEEELSDRTSEIATSLIDTYAALLGPDENLDSSVRYARLELSFPNDLSGADSGNVSGSDKMGTRETDADLEDLEKAATEHFPVAASAVLSANALVAATEGNEDAAFHQECSTLDSGSITSVRDAWMDLRDLLQDTTAANGARIHSAADALLLCAEAVGAVDEEAAEDVRKSDPDRDEDGDGKVEPGEGKIGLDDLPDSETSGNDHEPPPEEDPGSDSGKPPPETDGGPTP
ncbi:MAG: hypothetical protein ACRDXX_18425 [Stackebrandtia sp.]